MKMADIQIGKTYRTKWGATCKVLGKNVRESGYRGRPRTNVRILYLSGRETSIPARELQEEV